jgi:diadenosine tetraphosphate (Ap4A) HIT family hydrolase
VGKCPFCSFKNDARGTVVLRNNYCLYIQLNEEVLIGSGIIVPLEHRETPFDLTQKEWNATYEMLKEVKYLTDKQYNPQGYNIGWNAGKVAGQEVFHAHLHVIPRYSDEPYAGRGMRYWLKQPENKRI